MKEIKNLLALRFPIGKFEKSALINDLVIQNRLEEITCFPAHLREETKNLREEELNYSYRPNSWSIRQLVHHCADSRMNGFLRTKWMLTEDSTSIKPYFEAKWASLSDSKLASIEDSLSILEGMHKRWVFLLKNLRKDDFKREYIHPEYGKRYSLEEVICLYAWHGKHYLEHVRLAKKYRENWEGLEKK
ncbi:YfiT family bacillithiol transferase [Xanthovirga aplysinae]|uniref:YfiT family bacillithiol transferase n=1 Tax=Xanthovirga aplysinae TaxID=2529853 RepID=UPI0012BD7499|nr:putative metal-dependent hydrolase [Xanthovirga aplysinae]MTI30275.1 putative metal-dependent hydrolase [Xanthovirga aplysinae]